MLGQWVQTLTLAAGQDYGESVLQNRACPWSRSLQRYALNPGGHCNFGPLEFSSRNLVRNVDRTRLVSVRRLIGSAVQRHIAKKIMLFTANFTATHQNKMQACWLSRFPQGVLDFVCVQRLTPFLSEFPEKVSAFYRGSMTRIALTAPLDVVSSDLDRPTGLVPMLLIVFGLGPLNMRTVRSDEHQAVGIFLTLAQSLLRIMLPC
jgi:hypothetical protein